MKNEKINLEELQVESFVTSLTPEEQAEQKGGTTTACAITIAASLIFSVVTYVSVTLTAGMYD